MKEIREVSVINKAERRFLKYITEHDNKLEKKKCGKFFVSYLTKQPRYSPNQPLSSFPD